MHSSPVPQIFWCKRCSLQAQGEAQREIVRVAVDCCLQESTWNPYYAALLKNVLAASQAHCITAQFCIWDHLKELNSQAPRRLSNLARLTAHLIVSQALPMSALRVRLLFIIAMAPSSTLGVELVRKVQETQEILYNVSPLSEGVQSLCFL